MYVVNILHDENKKIATEQPQSMTKKFNTDNGLQGQRTGITGYQHYAE